MHESEADRALERLQKVNEFLSSKSRWDEIPVERRRLLIREVGQLKVAFDACIFGHVFNDK
jgi:hypothetical protein